MDFRPDPRDEQRRQELREFVRARRQELFGDGTAGSQPRHYSAAEVQLWTRTLNTKGWVTPHWPNEWGGASWPAGWRHIRDEELAAANCPGLDLISTDFVGPVIYTFGTTEQKQRYLPRIRSGDDVWCQGFSESDAGSDLQRIKCAAVRSGSQFVVTGRKLWTTNAHNANMMFALVRPDAGANRRQQGLSLLLIDMRSPGITVRPILTLDGRHWVNEVILDDVRVPAENLVGESGKGWIYARFILGNERTTISGLASARQQLLGLRRALAKNRRGDITLDADPAHQERLALMEMELDALEFLKMRALDAEKGSAAGAVLGSILKLRASELRQRISEAALEAFGDASLEFLPLNTAEGNHAGETTHRRYAREVAANFLFLRSSSIAGGTSEVQRNIIAEVGLRL